MEIFCVTDTRDKETTQTADFSGSIGIDSYQQLWQKLVEVEAVKAEIILQQAQQFFSDR